MKVAATDALPTTHLERPSAPEWLMVGANLDPRFGGVSAAMAPLCSSTNDIGDVRVSLAAFCEPDEDLSALNSAVTSISRFPLRGMKSLVVPDENALAKLIALASGVHIHGIWQEHCLLAARIARTLGKPYIISAHGMLDSWALRKKRLKKAAYMALFERKNLRSAFCLHALTKSEVRDYAELAPDTPVAVIPNGVDLPPSPGPRLFLERFPQLRGRTIILFLARLHPKKGLDILSEAWQNIAPLHPNATLVLAGPDSENTRQSIEQRVNDLGIGDQVLFTGMLAGDMKWSALAAAALFVLPSYSEGLSMSVLEALASGIPVLITAQCHVEGVVENGCGWQIQPNVAELENALKEFFASSEERTSRMGASGVELARRCYSWARVGAEMSSLYRWALGGTQPSQIEIYRSSGRSLASFPQPAVSD
jgi:glycosyltransferase involved in cell wall biosynthesis